MVSKHADPGGRAPPAHPALFQVLASPRRIAAWVLVVFGFAAWNLTGLANAALALLGLLFLLDLPRAWPRLRRDWGFLLMLGAPLVLALLALRGSALFPETVPGQWDAVAAWSAPLLFVVAAWWLRGNEPLIRAVLLAACLGLLIGVTRKLDWAHVLEMLSGARYESAYPALVLGFLASLMLVALLALRRNLVRLAVRGRRLPVLGWGLWLLGIAISLALLVVTEARGSVLSLGIIAVVWVIAELVHARGAAAARIGLAAAALIGSAVLVSAVLVSSGDRLRDDVRLFDPRVDPRVGPVFDYESSLGVRLNLQRIGFALISERPVLGWGPGSLPLSVLVPAQVVPVAREDLDWAPRLAHLHSVPLEIGVRFGLPGLFLGLAFLAVVLIGYRAMLRGCRDIGLRRFLVYAGLLTLLYSLFDFRLVHLDLRFVFILLFGMVYGFVFTDAGREGPAAAGPAAGSPHPAPP